MTLAPHKDTQGLLVSDSVSSRSKPASGFLRSLTREASLYPEGQPAWRSRRTCAESQSLSFGGASPPAGKEEPSDPGDSRVPREQLLWKPKEGRWGRASPEEHSAPQPGRLSSSRLCNPAMNRPRCVVWCQGGQTCFLWVTTPLWNSGR